MDIFKLSATLTCNKQEYDNALDDAEKKASSSGSKIGGFFAGMGKAAAAGLAVASGASMKLIKDSAAAYADYEQLVGGVETLFGTGGKSLEEYAQSVGKTVDEVKEEYAVMQEAQSEVLAYADYAYKNAGLSANEYIEQVTGMAAALKQSLGGDTWAAADKADKAITDMADNANKMGTSLESIQNAYAGFTKQNFTMLDNLKLGYGGTRTEMERLLSDAEAISGVHYDIESYADIVDAIHVMQDEMGIAGTTAKEATETISGSLGMLKGAWSNLVAGLADPNADISKLIGNVVTSLVGTTDEAGNHVKGFLDNIIPTIEQAAKGIVEVVKGMAPVIAEELPQLVNDVLPMLIETAIELFNGLIDALPTLLDTIFNQLPSIMSAIVNAVINLMPMVVELGLKFIMSLANGIIDAIPQIVPALIDVINKIADFFKNPSNLLMLLDAAVQIITELAMGIVQALPDLVPTIIEVLLAIVTVLTEPTNLMRLIDAALSIIIALADGLIQAIPVLLKAVPTIVLNLVEAFIMLAPQLLKSGAELIAKLIMGILQMKAKTKQAAIDMFNSIRDGFMERVERARDWGKDLIQNFIDGILDKWEDLKNTVKNVAQSVKDFLGFSEPKLGPLSNFHTYAPDMMELFAQGIKENKQMLLDTVQDAFNFSDMIVNPANVMSAGAQQTTNNTYNINLQGQVRSAADIARALREEAQYGIIGGGGFGN